MRLILIKQNFRYNIYFSMIRYFEKSLCSVAQEIRYTLFILLNKLFNVHIYRVCLKLLQLLLLLLNVITFAISQLKLKTFVRITIVVHKSSSPLRSSVIMKGKITNSLRPPLTKRPSEVGYCELNEMLGSGGCLRQKNLQTT